MDKKKKKKLWSGRFAKESDHLVDNFNASINFDYQLAKFDIIGSLAHVKMLGKCEIIEQKAVDLIVQGLHKIWQRIKSNKVKFSIQFEDIHTNIEILLHQEIGDVAYQLHTARSRNDQVALDLHLYLRYHILQISQKIHHLMAIFLNLAKDNIETIMPGYTHLQRAEPIRFAHYLLCYFNMFKRDAERLQDCFKRVNLSPLGAGGLAGSGMKIDRGYAAILLNFEGLYTNSLDAVSDRDFIVDFFAAAAQIMIHLAKISEEIILWSSHEFSFIELDDSFATGSSIMPQKKNPDVAELTRGKTGRVVGSLMSILMVLKGLPLAYNKDLQEDKEPLFDTVLTLTETLTIFPPMLASMKINRAQMLKAAKKDYANARMLASYLTKKGIYFRLAHEIAGKIVRYALEKNTLLKDLTLEEYQKFENKIDNDIYAEISLEKVVESHETFGSTTKKSIIEQIKRGMIELDKIARYIASKKKLIKAEL